MSCVTKSNNRTMGEVQKKGTDHETAKSMRSILRLQIKVTKIA